MNDNLTFHPACLAWPEMDEAALKELADDIAKNGLVFPILTWKGQIVDGRNRVLACRLANEEPQFKAMQFKNDAEVWSFVCSLNAHRRHLTREQKDEALAKRLVATPQHSNRRIADEMGVDHKTVAAARKAAEAGGEIPHLEKVQGPDGKHYPAHRKPEPKEEQTDGGMVQCDSTPAEHGQGRLDTTDGDGGSQPSPAAKQEPAPAPMVSGPARISGSQTDQEVALVREVVAHLDAARSLILKCERLHGLGTRMFQAWKKAEAAYLAETKGVSHVE